MAKNIIKLVAVFAVAFVGGIFSSEIIWPYFVERPLLYKYQIEKEPVYVAEKKEVIIRENEELMEAFDEVEKLVIGIKTKTKDGDILIGSGFIVTSDGLAVTLSSLIPKGSEIAVAFDGKWPKYEVLKRDEKNNLALIKIEGKNLPTAEFSNSQKIRVAKRVFFAATLFEDGGLQKSVPLERIFNEGVVKRSDDNLVETNISENIFVQGSPLFDVEGKINGILFVGENGFVSAVPVLKVRQFVGL